MKHNKKSLVLLASLLLAVCLTVGGTLAFLTTASGPVENTFKPSKVTTTVDEDFDGTTKSDVKIKNTGDTEAWIRAAIIVTWQNDKGEVYGKAPVSGTDYSIQWGSDWLHGGNGFYYYEKPVAPQGSTTALITRAEPIISEGNTEANTAGYYLNIEIIGSGIQSKPMSVFQDNWATSGFSMSSDGTRLEKTN